MNGTDDMNAPTHSAPHAPPTAAPAEDNFRRFAERGIELMVALCGMPIVLAYLNAFSPPENLPIDSRTVTMLTALVSALVVLSMFWHRQAFASTLKAYMGFFLLVMGGVLAFGTKFIPVLGENSYLSAAAYMVGFVTAIAGIGMIFLNGFVRNQERMERLSDLAVRLDVDQWAKLQEFARAIVSARHFFASRKMGEHVARVANHIIDDSVARVADLSRGTLRTDSNRLERLLQELAKQKGGSVRIFAKFSADGLGLSEIKRMARLFNTEMQAKPLVALLLSRFGSPNAIKKSLEPILAYAQLDLASDADCQGIEGELNFILIGNHAAATWNPHQGRLKEITVNSKECEVFEQRAHQIILAATPVAAASVCIDTPEQLEEVLGRLFDPARATFDRSGGRKDGPVPTGW